jgi:integrase
MTKRTWSQAVGTAPHTVTVYERADKAGVLYLRWWADGDWKRSSLRRKLRDDAGRIDAEVKAWAIDQAKAKQSALAAGTAILAQAGPLTLQQGRDLMLDAVSGKWPRRTARTKVVQDDLDRAIAVLGGDFPLAKLTMATLRKVWRARITDAQRRGHDGYRPAEITIGSLLSLTAWLRREDHLDAGAGRAPETWRVSLREDWGALTGRHVPTPKRDRHTAAELRAILVAAWAVDPRLGLLLELGAELRGGQVLRCRRSDCVWTAAPEPDGTWLVTIRGAGKKGGEVMELTAEQARTLTQVLRQGYLAPFEQEGGDFPLFPAGQLVGGRSGRPRVSARQREAQPVGRRAVLSWFREAEERAGVAHIRGRSLYGLRRAGVDRAKELGISREALKRLGGWSDTQVPDAIYAEQDNVAARQEAARVRGMIRADAAEIESDSGAVVLRDVPEPTTGTPNVNPPANRGSGDGR